MNKFNHARSSLQFQTMSNSTLAGFSKSSTLEQPSNQNPYGSLSSSYNDFKPQSFPQANAGGSTYVDGSQFTKTSSADSYLQSTMDNQSTATINPQANNVQYQNFNTNPVLSDFGRHSSVMMMGQPMKGDTGEANGNPMQGGLL
jgi:hypothetical protein